MHYLSWDHASVVARRERVELSYGGTRGWDYAGHSTMDDPRLMQYPEQQNNYSTWLAASNTTV
jgi:hypothetical protein